MTSLSIWTRKQWINKCYHLKDLLVVWDLYVINLKSSQLGVILKISSSCLAPTFGRSSRMNKGVVAVLDYILEPRIHRKVFYKKNTTWAVEFFFHQKTAGGVFFFKGSFRFKMIFVKMTQNWWLLFDLQLFFGDLPNSDPIELLPSWLLGTEDMVVAIWWNLSKLPRPLERWGASAKIGFCKGWWTMKIYIIYGCFQK